MKRFMAFTTLAALLAAPLAMAGETPSFSALDTDGNGGLTLTEAQGAWPDLTLETFIRFDSDGDGLLSPDEYEALTDWKDAGPGDADAAPEPDGSEY